MTIAEANALGRDDFIAAFGWIFEDSPWVAERAWMRRPFADRNALHRAMVAEVESSDDVAKLDLLRAHPDLGTRARMSNASAGEQSGAGLDRMARADFDRLQAMNTSYRDRFGFPFLFAVKGSTVADILAALERRLQSSPEAEIREALVQVYRIASFRLQDTVTGD
jgi:2-oxo-4-hydroxy-4-carboxy-5-ureidoimidazoline decarboxylase